MYIIKFYYKTCEFYRRQPALPSFSRKSKGRSETVQSAKKKKAIETYERDIVCLPHDHPNDSGLFTYPRGKVRTMLARRGLIGKIAIHSWMNEEDIRAEVCSCFSRPFANDESFPFKFLQSAGIGAKALIVPATSERYEWKPKQVLGYNEWFSGYLHLGPETIDCEGRRG